MTFFRSKPRPAATETKRKTGPSPMQVQHGLNAAMTASDLDRLRRRPTYWL